MFRSLAFVLALVAAGPASALTCMRMDVGQSFENADMRPETFVVVLGSLTRTGENVPDGPETGDPNNRVGYAFEARFTGHVASSAGFVDPLSVPVKVVVECVIAWCGADSLSEHGLYFLRRDSETQYVLEAGACPLYFHDVPTEHQLMGVIGLMP